VYFANALTIARQQQAKSWELRAAMSMARIGTRTDDYLIHLTLRRCLPGCFPMIR
jgi:hypothetical protein